MSQQNHFQPWKQNSLTPQNITINNNHLHKINYQSATTTLTQQSLEFHQQIEPANNKNKINNFNKINDSIEPIIGSETAVAMVKNYCNPTESAGDGKFGVNDCKTEIMQQFDEAGIR